jgi:3-hydroxy acid dehydrogenase / malonic semialdehyde reductase
MTDLSDRIVFITGASSGIGEACACAFAAQGSRLLLAARREERLTPLARKLTAGHHVECRVIRLDVRDKDAVKRAIGDLPEPWSRIEVLVNNAGLSRGMVPLQQGDLSDWDEMIDTNLKGLLYVSRAVLPGMISRGRGHIINLGSLAGHEVYPNGNVYCATKYAVRALSESLRLDLVGTPLRVSSVDPGMVETEFSLVRFHGDAGRAKKVYEGLVPLTAADVADAVLYCATRPAHVNIGDIVMTCTAQRSTTLAYRAKS